MANEEIIVGKHTLESLTIGMYSDPFTIYREYIQNAVDSIDEAVKSKIMTAKEAKIEVNLNRKDFVIEIKDNGTGICAKDAYKILGDIGNSKKDYAESRGFRGIGRLGGLGYADKLIFETSCKGENKKTIIEWDCLKLKEMLQPAKYKTHDLLSVIKEVTKRSTDAESSDAHYFIVRLENVDQQYMELLNEDDVSYYLSTVAPVPFDCQKFIFGSRIKEYFDQKRQKIEDYKIILNKSPKPIMKKYATQFSTGQQERTEQDDTIIDIEFFEGRSDKGELLYLGWIGICGFKGTIQDDYMRGIRIRKGNILIGSEQTFGQFFSSEPGRANGVFIGEVYIFWKDIIPNARRDDFEKNGPFKELYGKLRETADDFNRKYRRGYSQLNSALRKVNEGIEKIEEIKTEIKDGITSDVHKEKLLDEKNKIELQVSTAISDLTKIHAKSGTLKGKSEEVEAAIKMLPEIQKDILKLENKIVDTDFKGKDELSFLTRDQRNIYRTIIEVIDGVLEKEMAKGLVKKIIHALKQGGKKKK
jgi:molecular chaperone HtpG